METLFVLLTSWKFYVNLFLWGLLISLSTTLFDRKVKKPKGAKEVPRVVKGWLPFAGNGLSFSKDIIGFIRNNLQTYGKIFRIKVFRKEIVVILDHKLKKEFFKAAEEKLSLYQVLDGLYFSDAFSDDPTFFTLIIRMVKKSVGVKFDSFMPKIIEEAKTMTERMRKNDNKEIQIVSEMIRFVARTSARCFIGIDMSEEFFDNMLKFTNFLNKLVILTYFFPKWFIRFFFNPFLRKYRMNMTRLLLPEIQKYRDDLSKDESVLFRRAVDYIDDETGEQMTNQMIGDTVVCLLYVSSENTALGLSNTMIDLSCHPKYWDAVKNESKKFLENNDFRGLMSGPMVNAALMESARMNTHVFPLSRRPMNKQLVIGEERYFVGDADVIGLCEPFMQKFECAEDYESSESYNPHRFLDPINEKETSECLMTWGHGVHLCPGKQFAIMEMKTAMAFITNNFERFNVKIGNMNYFSPSAFAEREARLTLKVLKPETNTAIEYVEPGGWLIRNCLTVDQQIEFYRYTLKLSENSDEQREYEQLPKEKLYPLTYYRLVYTNGSNCEEPTKWLEWATNLWSLCNQTSEETKFPKNESYTFNSVYAQLYAAETVMATHKDQHVTWGVSVSLGASCDFLFGDKTLVLNSGDVLIADFSKIDHAVLKVKPDSVPHWFTDDYNEGDKEKWPIKTFGRIRCSIQIRYVPEDNTKLMSTNEFKEML